MRMDLICVISALVLICLCAPVSAAEIPAFHIEPMIYDISTDSRFSFIDASNECVKVTNNNKLTPENIDHIVDAFTGREDIEYLCHLRKGEHPATLPDVQEIVARSHHTLEKG